MTTNLRELDLELGISQTAARFRWGDEERSVVSMSNYVAGILLFLFLAGLLPLSLLVLASVLLVCLATCIRAYVVHHFEQAVSTAQGISSLEAAQLVSAAHSLMVGGQAIDLNNLRLSLIQRDFGSTDYETLLALDDSCTAPCQKVSEEVLASLPSFKHKKSCSQKCRKGEENICCVCLDAFASEAVVTQLRCKHSFHGDCILPWLRQQGKAAFCPLCKASVWPSK